MELSSSTTKISMKHQLRAALTVGVASSVNTVAAECCIINILFSCYSDSNRTDYLKYRNASKHRTVCYSQPLPSSDSSFSYKFVQLGVISDVVPSFMEMIE